jgi:hypothetical protein
MFLALRVALSMHDIAIGRSARLLPRHLKSLVSPETLGEILTAFKTPVMLYSAGKVSRHDRVIF